VTKDYKIVEEYSYAKLEGKQDTICHKRKNKRREKIKRRENNIRDKKYKRQKIR
jgi:hypothetical protein